MDPRVNGVPADNVGGDPRPAGGGGLAWTGRGFAARGEDSQRCAWTPDGPPPRRL